VESERRDVKPQESNRGKLKTALRVMGPFLAGIGFASISGSVLMAIRMPHSLWGFACSLVFLFVSTFSLFRKEQPSGSSQLLWFALWLCLIPLYFLRAQIWVPVAGATLFAIYFWRHLKSTGRSYPFMSAGCLLAGVLSLQVPWPNEQRCLLTLVGVGATASLQGLWIIFRYLQGHRPVNLLEPAEPSSKSSDKQLISFMHLVFGKIEHIQLHSPALEQRIRTRYQSEIYQLTGLGFDYQFSDGEAFSLFRLALLLPALIVFMMWCKREVMDVHGGTKILTAYSIFMSKNKTTFVHPNPFGVKYYTSFQDGTMLVSRNYGDKDGVGPTVMANPCKGASIADTWAKHQERLAELEAGGKRVNRQTSFQAYAEISHKETAAW
jgi:hypothetical protein